MKIIIKETTFNGDSLLVYLMTNDNIAINAYVTVKSELTKLIGKINKDVDTLPQVKINYKQYIRQDED